MKSSIGHLIKKLAPLRFSRGIAMATLVASAVSFNTYAQEYATGQTNSTTTDELLFLTASGTVSTPENAIGAPDNNYATLSSAGAVVTAIKVTGSATLNLTMPNPVPANKRAYVKIQLPTVEGLSINLGELVNLLGLLTSNTINVTTDAGTAQSTLVKDGANNAYIAVSSSAAFSEISIKLDLANYGGTLPIALGQLKLNVDGVISYETASMTPCEQITYAFAGINPSATGIVGLALTPTLQNPQEAVDGVISPTNFALLQNGAVAAITSVSESFYLAKESAVNNELVAIVSRPPALANLAVLDNISFQAYQGNTPVGAPRSLTSLLTLDLLGLFTANTLTPVRFTPGGAFDRVVVTSTTGLNLNLFTGLRIHELASRPPVSFSGGTVAAGRVGDPLSSNLFGAQNGGSNSFSIQCGLSTDYTYALYQVSAPGGRTLAGTLPNTVTLNPNGTFSGTPTNGQNGTYTFDVQATNQFGQTGITTFTMTIENALPVTLVSFKAFGEGQTAALSWTTSEETNSERFDIERSQNGKNWTKIGSLVSRNEGKVNQSYSFVDATPLRGDNYYRLKMVDFDATFAYSSIENLNFKGIALVYPNPVSASQNLTLNVGDWSSVSGVKVVNAAGKVVFEASNALLSGISARNLVAGTYVVQVTHIDGTVSSQRFVRQ
ncbi:Por secretion system C-terminal sorting domain-containing protein [Dyadobacter soli]|uniref:Por secretion system C-terminal sorting domain-containing protein n=1 Tax=Dyadobacter soli TaxID=659014 RepID=A0A1G7DJR4_9BACT|nr:T9SS type A sorting domain-containing protein [Dyadobacter soli]SDE51743.1 Por secretion system C-terminal sorting domain-containing protein [Dyadobacter soli]